MLDLVSSKCRVPLPMENEKAVTITVRTNRSSSSSSSNNMADTLPRGSQPIPRPRARLLTIFSALLIALFLAALDTVILTTALPRISRLFSLSAAGYAWVGSAYLLSNAASVPFWGKISDVFGRKPVLLLANAVFMAGSIVSALAVGGGMLIAGRAVQGLGGGGIVILVNICVGDLFCPRERSLMYGIVGSVWAVASALGPIFGGLFTEKLSWRWCFWINLPLDGCAAAVLLVFLDVHNPRTPLLEGLRSIDWLGAITMAGGTVMLLLGLQFGGIQYAWSSATVVCLLVFGTLTFGVFFTTQFKLSASPIMPFTIFRHMSNFSALAVCFFDAFVFNSVAYFMPLYFQSVLAASPISAGVWMLALAIPLAICSALSGFYMERTGRYLDLLRAGLLFMTLGLGLCISLPAQISWGRIVGFLVLIGVGFGPNFHAPLIALQTHLAPRDVAAGTATFGFVRMLAGASGLVLGQVIFQGQMQRQVARMERAGVPKAVAEQLAAGSGVAYSASSDSDVMQSPSVRLAKAECFSRMWILYTVVSFLGLLASLGIKKVQLSRQHEEIRTGLDAGEASDRDSYSTEEMAGAVGKDKGVGV